MKVVEVADVECEGLFKQQATTYQAQPIGVHGVLPVSAEASPLYQGVSADRLVAANQPLWIHREQDANHFDGLLFVDPTLAVFAGHFPGNPILPGVVLIDWATASAAAAFSETPATAFAGLSRVKFKSPVGPGAWLRLALTAKDGVVGFTFSDNRGVCTAGRLQYHG